MFRQAGIAALLFTAVIGHLSPAVAQEQPGRTQATNSIGMKLVLIPPGEFLMGNGRSAREEAAAFKPYGIDLKPEAFKNEYPQHRVRITRPFLLGMYHVTRGQFRQFVEAAAYQTDAEKGTSFKGAVGYNPATKTFKAKESNSWRNPSFPQTDEHPVVDVSWNDATEFCKWLSWKEGKQYRLPTEAEWEYACRAGTTTRYSSGDDPETLVQVGNVRDAAFKAKFPDQKWTLAAHDGYVFTSPVGSFRPNAFGLYDMHGNAFQWCQDWYGADYYAISPPSDPPGPATGADRVFRGGGCGGYPWICRSAARLFYPPAFRYYSLGFRVARTL